MKSRLTHPFVSRDEFILRFRPRINRALAINVTATAKIRLVSPLFSPLIATFYSNKLLYTCFNITFRVGNRTFVSIVSVFGHRCFAHWTFYGYLKGVAPGRRLDGRTRTVLAELRDALRSERIVL